LARATGFALACGLALLAVGLPVGLGFFLFSRGVLGDDLREIGLHMEDSILFLHAAAMLLYLFAVLVFSGVALRLFERGARVRDLGLRWRAGGGRLLAWASLAGGLLLLAALGIAGWRGAFVVTGSAVAVEGWGDLWLDLGGNLLLLSGLVLAEEIAFRGYVRTTLARALSPRAAVLIAGMLYAVYRAALGPPTLLAALNALLTGLILGALALASGTLWVPIAARMVWVLIQGAIFSLPVSGEVMEGVFITRLTPSMWLGGAAGAEAGLLWFVALSIGAVLTWVTLRKRLA
jgi:membrane protease YdiL (CAAX protease family)